MDEHGGLVARSAPLPNMVTKPCQALAGVNGLGDDALGAGQQGNRFAAGGGSVP